MKTIEERSTKNHFAEFQFLSLIKTINCTFKCLIMLNILPHIFFSMCYSLLNSFTTNLHKLIVVCIYRLVMISIKWSETAQKNALASTDTIVTQSLADLVGGGGVPGARHPLWDPILSFLHTFSLKSTCIGGPHPSQWVHAPLQEILDPPLPVATLPHAAVVFHMQPFNNFL